MKQDYDSLVESGFHVPFKVKARHLVEIVVLFGIHVWFAAAGIFKRGS